MPYTHLLVAVAPTPESQVLIKKAVSIARPVNAKVSLITLATDPELYNQFAAPMMENLREVMQEETREFLNELARHADYPIERMTIACAAPANCDRTSTPGLSGSCAATYSFATRFIPSRSGVTSPTSE